MNPTFREIAFGSADYIVALQLRHAVLRAPLGLDFSAEELVAEPTCRHFVVEAQGKIVGTLLLQPVDDGTVKMRQVAIQPELQGCGLGAQLVRFSEDEARKLGFRRMIAHARSTAGEFYRRLGYRTEGDTFTEQTIPHVKIAKTLGD